MPRDTSIKKVLVIGSGPIVIGQAAEFDYAGTQACRSLKEEGVEVVLVNSNPATIMTDPNIADEVYIEPLTIEVLEQIIIKAEHNYVSASTTYSNRNFVPIEHEYLMVLRKDAALLIPVSVAKRCEFSVLDAETSTWKDIVQAVMEENGTMKLSEIYNAVKDSARAKKGKNNSVEAKVRQTLQHYKNIFKHVSEGEYVLAS